jgi:hypothetical protein
MLLVVFAICSNPYPSSPSRMALDSFQVSSCGQAFAWPLVHTILGNEWVDTVTITSQLVIKNQSIGVATAVCFIAVVCSQLNIILISYSY